VYITTCGARTWFGVAKDDWVRAVVRRNGSTGLLVDVLFIEPISRARAARRSDETLELVEASSGIDNACGVGLRNARIERRFRASVFTPLEYGVCQTIGPGESADIATLKGRIRS